MALFPIYISDAAASSDGSAINQALVNVPASRFSVPFRMCGSRPAVRSYDLMLQFRGAAAGTVLELRMYREAFITAVDPRNVPSANFLRVLQVQDLGGGVLQASDGLYRLQLELDTPVLLEGIATRAAWERLCVWVAGAVPAAAELDISVHLGGHEHEDYLDALTTPYAYNAPP